MKKSLLALAALTAFAGAASAQSSVTLFGVVDAGVRSVKNGNLGSIQSQTSGGNTTSRWGIRGSEDLGNSTSAQFWLESDLLTDTGVAGATTPTGQLFNRRATLGLVNASAGEVRLGRDYVPTHTVMCAYDPFGCTGIATVSTFRNTGTAAIATAFPTGDAPLVRANNSVQYLLPSNLGGLNGGLFVSAGEGGTPAAGSSKTQGARLGYAAGPVSVSAAFTNTKNTVPRAVATGGAGVTVAPAAGTTFKDVIFGGSFDFGVVKVAASRRTYKIASEKAAQTAVALSARLGQGIAKAQYVKLNQNGSVPANDASLFGLGYEYSLSKRTALYGTVSRISNKGGAYYAIAGGPAVSAPTGALASNFAGQKSTGYEFGIRHLF